MRFIGIIGLILILALSFVISSDRKKISVFTDFDYAGFAIFIRNLFCCERLREQRLLVV